MNKIDIQFIPHHKQRYNTVGDYYEQDDSNGTDPGSVVIHFRISLLGNATYEWLVLAHELVEYFLVKRANIGLPSIDTFDEVFEMNRKEGDLSEPGDSPLAPYHTQHQRATSIERICALLLGVDWGDYEDTINSL